MSLSLSSPHNPTRSTPSRPSPFSVLLRLTRLLSILLGTSSLLALFSSTFLLPLLSSGVGARLAIVSPQLERWKRMIRGLKGVDRALKALRTGPGRTEGKELVQEDIDQEKPASTPKLASCVMIPTNNSSNLTCSIPNIEITPTNASPNTSTFILTDNSDPSLLSPLTPLTPIASTSLLVLSLRDLVEARNSTSTTRLSLLSTIESYTSSLHRDLFVSRGFGGMPGPGGVARFGNGGFPMGMNSPGGVKAKGFIGLGTLSENLARAGGGGGGSSGTSQSGIGLGGQGTEGATRAGVDGLAGGIKGEEWDSVRKEVRAIKGLLLNRRNFS